MSITYDIHVQVEPEYIEEQSSPDEDRYLFAYNITIENNGTIPARLLTRFWRITDANNRVQEVHGEGVVGQKPYLRPGESFAYTSSAIIETPVGCMHGSYQMLADDGIAFDADIPAFTLSIPNALH